MVDMNRLILCAGKAVFCGITVFFLLVVPARASSPADMPAFSTEDRVLFLAPHPDDEAIGGGGILQQALADGAAVKVACFTNGDHNEFAFIVYEKRLTFRKGEFMHMGRVRNAETKDALSSLGLRSSDVLFMGYPDFGTLEIFTKFWGRKESFRSLLTRVSQVYYKDAISFGAPYIGESILRDLKTILMGFKPTKIFVSHPADTNRDHQSLGLFLQVALWDLDGAICRPEVFPYIVHVVGWPKVRGRSPQSVLTPPPGLEDVAWSSFTLSDKQIAGKIHMISYYKSQIAYNPPYLFTFARRNELFGALPPIPVPQSAGPEPVWVDVRGGKRKEAVISYARVGSDLLVKVALRRKLHKNFGLQMYLLGYKKGVDFAQMPKLAIDIGLLGMKIRDKRQIVFNRSARMYFDKQKDLIISVPMAMLGKPDYIMSRVRRKFIKLPLNAMSWRILEL